MAVLPRTHPLAERDFVYWTDLRDERFLMSIRDPGPEIRDILISKLAAPDDRPFIKTVTAHHSVLISMIASERGVTLVCDSSASLPQGLEVVFREVRDGNGPTRLGFVAYWRRDNDSPILKQFLASLQSRPDVLAVYMSAVN